MSEKPANFSDADLDGSYFVNADLKYAFFGRARLTNVDLTGADLTNADLTDADLTGATLTGTILTNAILKGAKMPTGWTAP